MRPNRKRVLFSGLSLLLAMSLPAVPAAAATAGGGGGGRGGGCQGAAHSTNVALVPDAAGETPGAHPMPASGRGRGGLWPRRWREHLLGRLP
jgi:hypothetical protein